MKKHILFFALFSVVHMQAASHKDDCYENETALQTAVKQGGPLKNYINRQTLFEKIDGRKPQPMTVDKYLETELNLAIIKYDASQYRDAKEMQIYAERSIQVNGLITAIGILRLQNARKKSEER